MSKQTSVEVQYVDENGVLVRTITDKNTARAFGRYNNIYHNIESFDIGVFPLAPIREGYEREAVIAQSRRLKVVCIKEFVPNAPEYIIDPRYECGILHKKSQEVERIQGGVEMLFYKLFRGRVK